MLVYLIGRKFTLQGYEEWVVPFCVTYSQALNGGGGKERWWKERSVDPAMYALRFWADTRLGNARSTKQAAGESTGTWDLRPSRRAIPSDSS